MAERPWSEIQHEAEMQVNRMTDEQLETFRARLRMLPVSIRKAWREQDGRGMAVGSADDLAFIGLIQPILEEVPPHTTFSLEMCRALVVDLVSNEEQS